MKTIVLLVATILLISCNAKEDVPKHVIPKDEMIDIILDIHLTDGLFTITKVRRDFTKNDSLNYYNEIFQNYGYTRADFDTSVYYYSKKINEYDKIYEEVLNRLNEMDTELRQKKEKQTEE